MADHCKSNAISMKGTIVSARYESYTALKAGLDAHVLTVTLDNRRSTR